MTCLREVSPSSLGAYWPELELLLERLREKGMDQTDREVRSHFNMGNWKLWIVEEGKAIVGYLATEITNAGYIHLPLLLAREGKRVNCGGVVREIERMAEGSGLRGLQFLTPREGWQRLAPKLGFRPEMVRWTKDW